MKDESDVSKRFIALDSKTKKVT